MHTKRSIDIDLDKIVLAALAVADVFAVAVVGFLVWR